MTTNVDLTNRALAEIGTRSQIVSMTDGSQEAQYANLLYGGLRDFLLCAMPTQPVWARKGQRLTLLKSAPRINNGYADYSQTAWDPAVNPELPWLYSYLNPQDNLLPLQIKTQPFFAPVWKERAKPFRLGFDATTANHIILTNEANAILIYITNSMSETIWDSMFTEAFVRLLASALAFALENRIEASREKLQEAISFAGMASRSQAPASMAPER